MLDKNTLFRIFEESKDKFKIKIKKRQLLDNAIKLLDFKEIIAITGVRRSGKTYLMYELMQYLIKKVNKESIVYINFEDERLSFLETKDLDKIFEYFFEFRKPEGKIYFFFDEIQNVPKWEKWIARSYEKYKFIISGSNSGLLSSELTSAIAGRYVEIHVYPFSFKEICDNNLSIYKIEDVGKIKKKYNYYLEFGGFPEIIINRRKELLQEYYRSILLKDVISRYNIKYKDVLEKLSLLISSNIGKLFSLYKLNKEFDIGINTIKNYVNYIEKSFLFFSLSKFDYSLRKQMFNPKKFYSIDWALSNSINFKFSEDYGRILENVVFIELKRMNNIVYYHKNKHECDFVIKKGLKIVNAIQVTKELNDENKQREINGLIEALKTYKLKEGTILTAEQEKTFTKTDKQGKKYKIIVKPIWKYLLEK